MLENNLNSTLPFKKIGWLTTTSRPKDITQKLKVGKK